LVSAPPRAAGGRVKPRIFTGSPGPSLYKKAQPFTWLGLF
jgi:hypothetical protein